MKKMGMVKMMTRKERRKRKKKTKIVRAGRRIKTNYIIKI
jgi:hypothetical protein